MTASRPPRTAHKRPRSAAVTIGTPDPYVVLDGIGTLLVV